MASDWIPVRVDIHDDPAVVAASIATGADVDAIVGKLVRLWGWASRQTKNGNARGVTEMWLDHFVALEKFSESLTSSGWLSVTDQGIRIPKFDRWMSQTAKQRALTARRVAKNRARKCNGPIVTKSLPTEHNNTEGSVRLFVAAEHSESWPEAYRRARSVKAKLLPHFAGRLSKIDRDFVLKTTFLSVCVFTSDWIEDAVAGTIAKKRDNRLAYFRGILRNKAKDLGYNLNRLLDSITIPPKTPPNGNPDSVVDLAGIGKLPAEAAP